MEDHNLSEEVNLNIGINVSDITKSLDDVQKKTEDTKKGVAIAVSSSVEALRKTTQLAVLTLEAIYGSIDAVLRYAAEFAIQSAELLRTIALAYAAGGFTGLLAVKAAAQFASILAIYTQIGHMVNGRTEAATQSGRIAIWGRSMSTYVV